MLPDSVVPDTSKITTGSCTCTLAQVGGARFCSCMPASQGTSPAAIKPDKIAIFMMTSPPPADVPGGVSSCGLGPNEASSIAASTDGGRAVADGALRGQRGALDLRCQSVPPNCATSSGSPPRRAATE